jgi:CarD family transcriptional regulator
LAGTLFAKDARLERQGESMQPTFKIGDKTVYPAQGVTEIMGIESMEISGMQQNFYVLRVLDTDKKIRIPINKVNAVGLRSVIQGEEVEEVYEILRERPVKFDQQTWNRRYRRYLEKIKTGSVYDVAEVLRDLYLLKYDKNLSFGERKMLDTARQLLVKELSIAKESNEDAIETEIEEMFADAEPLPEETAA